MGLFSKIFGKSESPKETKYAEMLNGFCPIFSQFGTNIYASDVVQQAIMCIANEIKKLKPAHIREIGQDVITVSDDIQKILNKPNQLMTTSDFLEKIVYLLYLNYNVFIIPTWDEDKDRSGNVRRTYTGLFPINPSQVDFIEDADGTLCCRFYFENGKSYIVRYSDIIHRRYRYSVNEFMGGNEDGQPDNEALLKTLRLNNQMLDGVSNAMKSSFAINGIIKYNTMMDKDKMDAALKELQEHLKKNEHGFLPIDLKAEYIPINKDIQMVDPETLKFIDEKILRQFGVPLCILTGDYTKAQYEAFYQKTLEPLIISLSQGFTNVLFSDTERSYGNKVEFYPEDLIFMSIDQRLEMVTLLSNTGAMYENEKRRALGLMPLPELEGLRFQSLNWVDANIASQYQTGVMKNGGEEDAGN